MIKKKLAIIFILLSLFIIPEAVDAAVPVIVFGDYLNTVKNVEAVWEIHENTQLELSLEGFMINLFKTFAERQEEFTKTFELAKIEKAREDVNKLNFEVQKELTGQGVIIEAKDKVTNQIYTIKKEGRMITNPDEFLFEEPIQKARDFTYCYLAPWKHFALDSNDEQYCADLGLGGGGFRLGKDGNPLPCTTENVCQFMPLDQPNGITQCPSDVARDQIKQQLLSDLVRKETNWAKAPTESWYTPAICERITNNLSCTDKETCFKCGDDILSQSCDIKTKGELTNEETRGVNDSHSSLTLNIASSRNATLQEYQETVGNPNNDTVSLKKMLKQQIQGIVDQYQILRQAQYVAGQGIRPEKYLISFTDIMTGTITSPCNRYYREPASTQPVRIPNEKNKEDVLCRIADAMYFGRPLTMSYGSRAYTDQFFWFDTENITSPAVILLQKMAAAAQAQFDLAQKAYKYPADNSELTATTISNGAGNEFSDIPVQTPSIPFYEINSKGEVEISKEETVNYLYAPWEDPFDYAKLPKNYSTDKEGKVPLEIGGEYYLNRWYKDINQMYLRQKETESSTFSRILKEWFCLESDAGLDVNCYEFRDPKYNQP